MVIIKKQVFQKILIIFIFSYSSYTCHSYEYVFNGGSYDGFDIITSTEICFDELVNQNDNFISDNIEIRSYPNPFYLDINFLLKTDNCEPIQLIVHNIKGQIIKTMTYNPDHQLGENLIRWNGKDFNNNQIKTGIYLLKFIIGKNIFIHKIIFLNK